MVTINIYPECTKPEWLNLQSKIYVWGEGIEIFTIDSLYEDRAILINEAGHCHGAESYTKIHRYRNS